MQDKLQKQLQTNKMQLNLLLFIQLTIAAAIIDRDFILNYYKLKSFKYATIYTCGTSKELMRNLKYFSEMNIPISVKLTKENLTRAMLPLQDTYYMGIVIDLDCDNLESFYKDSTAMQIFDYNHHFLLVRKKIDGIYEKLSELEMNINSDVKLAVLNGTNWLLYDIYKASSKYKSKLSVSYYGMQRKNGKFIERTKEHRNMYEERRNLNGIQFVTFTVIPDPIKWSGTAEEHVRSDVHTEINSFNRVGALFVIYASEYYNFTQKMLRTNSWGYLAPNGTWDGLVRGLQDGVIDFGGSPIFQMKERFAIASYGRTVWGLASAFIFRHPKHKTSFEVFFRPLDSLVWIMIVISGVVIVLIMRLAVRFEVGTHQQDEVDGTWSSLILFVIGALCQQGAASLPLFFSGRIISIFVFIFTILLYQFYSGSIVAFLLMQPARTIRTIEQLALSDLKIGCEDIVYNHVFFEPIMKLKPYNRLGEKHYKKDVPFYLRPVEGLSYVAKGQYAFHVELSTAYPIIAKTFNERQICDLEEITFFDSKGLHSAFPKRSPYRDMIDYILQKSAERGLIRRQRIHYHAPRPECIGSQTFTSAVGIDEFYPALLILVFGMLFSLIALIAENILAYKSRLAFRKFY